MYWTPGQYVIARTREMSRGVARPDAIVSEECMLKWGWRECPCFAQLARDTLYIDTVFFNIHRAIPLSELYVFRIVTGWYRYAGWNGWIGKHRIQMVVPSMNRRLTLGVTKLSDWRRGLLSPDHRINRAGAL